jgi:uncharacterized membrane protein
MTRARGLRAGASLVALAGLGIATYLTVVHYAGASPVCAISHGCETVQTSSYAKLAGVPVAVLGLIGYVLVLGSLLRDDEVARMAGALIAFAGFAFSAWLTYTEIAKIHAICIWCVGSAICMTVLMLLTAARAVLAPPEGEPEVRARAIGPAPLPPARRA